MTNPLILCAMSRQDAEQICGWQYEPPYDCYQFPAWQQMCEQDMDFANDDIREQQYRSLYYNEQFVGFIQLFPLLNVARLGIFLAPQYCGQGLGSHAVAWAVQAAREQHSEAEIDLEVEIWNKRAISCYKKAGFVITDQYEYMQRGKHKQVYCMVYER